MVLQGAPKVPEWSPKVPKGRTRPLGPAEEVVDLKIRCNPAGGAGVIEFVLQSAESGCSRGPAPAAGPCNLSNTQNALFFDPQNGLEKGSLWKPKSFKIVKNAPHLDCNTKRLF